MSKKEKIISVWQKFSKLRYNVLMVPKEGSGGKRIYKIDFYKFIIFFIAVGLIAHFIFLGLLVYTPIRNILPGFNIITEKESTELVQLRNKLESMGIEFEKMRERNIRLTYLIEGKPIPTDKRLLDSNYMKEKYKRDSINLFNNVPLSNDVYKAFINMLTVLVPEQVKQKNQTPAAEKKDSIGYNTTYFISPVDGIITQGFLPEKGHYGIDYGIKRGTVVRAAASGVVIFSDYTINDGNKIIISHQDGYITIYKHLSVLLRKEKEIISQSDVIGLSGNSGELSTNPHLHFEIWKNNLPINPKTICVNLNEY